MSHHGSAQRPLLAGSRFSKSVNGVLLLKDSLNFRVEGSCSSHVQRCVVLQVRNSTVTSCLCLLRVTLLSLQTCKMCINFCCSPSELPLDADIPPQWPHRPSGFTAGHSATTKFVCLSVFLHFSPWDKGEELGLPSVCYFLDRDMGIWVMPMACTCSVTIFLDLPDTCFCACRAFSIWGVWPNSSFFTWKKNFQMEEDALPRDTGTYSSPRWRLSSYDWKKNNKNIMLAELLLKSPLKSPLCFA